MSELFNQTLAALDVTKRLAFGQPSQLGCDNILISAFITALQDLGLLNKVTSHAFDIADSSYDYTAARYEMIEEIIIKELPTGETIEILGYIYDSTTGLYNGGDLIEPEIGQSEVFSLKHYCSSSVTFERGITIIPSASCTIIIKSTKGL